MPIDGDEFEAGQTDDVDKMDAETRQMMQVAQGVRKAELEYKKQQRDDREQKNKIPRVQFSGSLSLTGEMQEIFKKYERYYKPVALRARYKPAYQKYREGYLVELRNYAEETDEYLDVIKAGAFSVTKGYRGIETKLMNISLSTSVIRHQGKAYVEFIPSWEGLLGLGGFVAVTHNDRGLVIDAVLKVLEKMVEYEVGEIDLAGLERTFDKCLKTITADDSRITNRHLLLAGPPGCGKSMIAKKLVRETPEMLHFNVTSNMDWSEIIPMLNEIVKWCDKRLLIIIDEIDEIGLNRDTSRAQVYQLLRLLDGTAEIKNVKFVATTNRPGDLDIALLRPGRLGPVFMVDLPDKLQIQRIVDYYNKKFDCDIEPMAIAKVEKISGSEIRTAFEDCIIYDMEMNTENVVMNLKNIKKGQKLDSQMFA